MRGLGNGPFEELPPITVGTSLYNPAVADVNGDGHLDILVVSPPYVAVLLNNGDGTFQAARDFSTGGSPQWLLPGDFDGDGLLDIGVVNAGSFALLRGAGDGSFTRGPNTSPPAWSPVAADFGNDGTLDLAAITSPDGRAVVLRDDGGGVFRGARYSETSFGASPRRPETSTRTVRPTSSWPPRTP